MIRAFLALPLPEPVRQQLNLLSFLLPLPRRLPVENLHLTLVFLGEQPRDVLEDLHHALEGLRLPPFALQLRGVESFGSGAPRSVHAGVAPSEPLAALQRKLETAARRAGVALERRRFAPHVTLARLDPARMAPGDLDRLRGAMVENAGFSAGPFTVEAFALYRSHLGRGAAHYEELARYPLAG